MNLDVKHMMDQFNLDRATNGKEISIISSKLENVREILNVSSFATRKELVRHNDLFDDKIKGVKELFHDFEKKTDAMDARVESFLKRLDGEDPTLMIVEEHLGEQRDHLNSELVKMRYEFHGKQALHGEDVNRVKIEMR